MYMEKIKSFMIRALGVAVLDEITLFSLRCYLVTDRDCLYFQ